MSINAPLSNGLIVAACAFDAQEKAVINSARSLAERFGMEVRFVNVVELMPYPIWAIEAPGYYPCALAWNMAEEGELMQQARVRLADTVAKSQLGARAKGEVLSGREAARTVIDYAKLCRASIIVTACADSYGLVAGGFSTAMTLMAESPVPVLAVKADQPLDAAKSPLRILLADDLEPGSENAARQTYLLAAQHGQCQIRHLHIHRDFRERSRDAFKRYLKDHPALAGDSVGIDKILADERSARVQRLHDRGGPFRKAVEAGKSTVEVEIREGGVTDTLAAVLEDFNPDLVVFGRHEMLKTRPFILGRVTLRTMLGTNRPVMVVPPMTPASAGPA